MVGLIFLLTIPQEGRAAAANFKPEVSIPGSNFTTDKAAPPSIAKYIQAIYNYAIGIVGILAAVVLMFGGVRWLTAGGSPDKITDAKAWIGASLSGLVLALASYMILNTINPDLVNLKDIAPPTVEKIAEEAVLSYGCCDSAIGDVKATKDGCPKDSIKYEREEMVCVYSNDIKKHTLSARTTNSAGCCQTYTIPKDSYLIQPSSCKNAKETDCPPTDTFHKFMANSLCSGKECKPN